MIDPLSFTIETGHLGHTGDFLERILVTVLRPNGFALLERDGKIHLSDGDALFP